MCARCIDSEVVEKACEMVTGYVSDSDASGEQNKREGFISHADLRHASVDRSLLIFSRSLCIYDRSLLISSADSCLADLSVYLREFGTTLSLLTLASVTLASALLGANCISHIQFMLHIHYIHFMLHVHYVPFILHMIHTHTHT
jgi:hypothetical protein